MVIATPDEQIPQGGKNPQTQIVIAAQDALQIAYAAFQKGLGAIKIAAPAERNA